MVVCNANLFHVLSNVRSLIGHHSENVRLRAMVLSLVIKHYRVLTVEEMIPMWKLDLAVQQQDPIRRVVQFAHVWIQLTNTVSRNVQWRMKLVLKLKTHYLHTLMEHQQMVHAVDRVWKFLVSYSCVESASYTVSVFTIEPEICSVVHLAAEFVTIDNCTSTHLIPQQQCLGGCISYAMSGLNYARNNCRCCSPATTSTVDIEMNCVDANGVSTIVSKPYMNILSCSCTACESTAGNQ